MRGLKRRLKRQNNCLQYAANISQHVIVPEPQHQITRCRQHFGPRSVVLALLDVLSTVEFNNKPGFSTAKVDDVLVDRKLASEFPTLKLTIAEVLPEQALRLRRFAS